MALSRVVGGLLKEGMTHSIVVLKGDAIIRDKFPPEVNIHCLHTKPHDFSVLLQLRKLIQQERPTVIHARNLGAWPEIAVARLAVWPWVPLVFSFHGVAEAKPIPWRWRMLSRLLARLTSHVFTVSQGSKQFLVNHVGLSANRLGVIPNGVDTAVFFPKPKAPGQTGLRIGTVGSLAPVKNQALLVKACHRLVQEGFDLYVDIAGEGPERTALENLIESLGLTGRVRLIGHISDTPAFLHSLDVFALPSDSEAHPNALSEAMACGLACIASRVGGIPEILNQGKAGNIFDPGDETGLVEGLRSLLGNPSLREELGQSALDYTLEQYAMTVMLERYGKLYRQLSGVAEASA